MFSVSLDSFGLAFAESCLIIYCIELNLSDERIHIKNNLLRDLQIFGNIKYLAYLWFHSRYGTENEISAFLFTAQFGTEKLHRLL